MALVYFESCGGHPHTIPEKNIAVIRPLDGRELAFQEKLRSGYFDCVDAFHAGGPDPQRIAMRRETEMISADLEHYQAPTTAKSALQTTAGVNYYLPQTVKEFAATLPNLVVLNGDTKIAATAAAPPSESGTTTTDGRERTPVHFPDNDTERREAAARRARAATGRPQTAASGGIALNTDQRERAVLSGLELFEADLRVADAKAADPRIAERIAETRAIKASLARDDAERPGIMGRRPGGYER